MNRTGFMTTQAVTVQANSWRLQSQTPLCSQHSQRMHGKIISARGEFELNHHWRKASLNNIILSTNKLSIVLRLPPSWCSMATLAWKETSRTVFIPTMRFSAHLSTLAWHWLFSLNPTLITALGISCSFLVTVGSLRTLPMAHSW